MQALWSPQVAAGQHAENLLISSSFGPHHGLQKVLRLTAAFSDRRWRALLALGVCFCRGPRASNLPARRASDSLVGRVTRAVADAER